MSYEQDPDDSTIHACRHEAELNRGDELRKIEREEKLRWAEDPPTKCCGGEGYPGIAHDLNEARRERDRLSDRLKMSRDHIAEIDGWLDEGVAETYQQQPLAQHWARVAKVTEEAGEAINALIAWTGQNPRKPQRGEARGELLNELADTALTAILGIQHFVKDADETLRIVDARLARLHARMHAKTAETE